MATNGVQKSQEEIDNQVSNLIYFQSEVIQGKLLYFSKTQLHQL